MTTETDTDTVTDPVAPSRDGGNRMRIRTALITASGNGLGRASAIRLASEGVHVAVVDIDPDGLAETVRTIEAAGGAVDSWVADCTDEGAILATAEAARDLLGPIDALVNNMGGSAGAAAAPFHEQTLAVISAVVHRCLMSGILWSHVLAPPMRAMGYGKIINIASDSAFLGDPSMSEYAAAKAGVVGFTRGLAQELAPHEVNVNAVAPGPNRTAANARLRPEVLQRAAEAIPMKRMGRPSDISSAVAFLASTEADYITGQTLIVDGGRWMN